MCAILLALDEEACLPASNRFIPVCVYAKTRDLILLRSCYADAGETEFRSTQRPLLAVSERIARPVRRDRVRAHRASCRRGHACAGEEDTTGGRITAKNV